MALKNNGTGVDIVVAGDNYFSKAGTYSVSEATTSPDPADTQAAFGQLTVDIADSDEAKGYMDEGVSLTDGQQGSTVGTVRGLTGNGTAATITADSRLGLTAVTRQMPPHNGTLGAAITAWLASCGITSGIVIDPAVGDVPVVLPGWKGVVYDQLKKLSAAHSFEMALVSGNLVFRPMRTRVAFNARNAEVTWAQDGTNFAQTVEGYYYNTTWREGALAYPGLDGWNEDVDVYSVDAGETKVVELPLEASLVSVDQPTCVQFVDRHHASSSVYSVTGADGLPVKPAQWESGGGKLEVKIGEDTKTLIVTITGSSDTEYAPYDIAASSGPSDTYSSLRILGTGAFTQQETLTLPANLDPDRAPEELGVTVDNEFYATADQLHRSLLWTSSHYATQRMSINVTTKGINRRGTSGVVTAMPTFGEVMALYPGATLGDMATELGPTFGDATAKLYELVKDDFANQAFGNVAGARVLHDDCWYRIRTATITADQVTYSAEWDTTLGDATVPGRTMGDWNAQWAGKTFGDVKLAPLSGIEEETW